jgi:hypothetical protein
VNFTRLEQEGISRRTAMTLTTAMKFLRSAEGDTHQIAIVPVRIVRMAFKVGANCFDAGVRMLPQFQPVISHIASEIPGNSITPRAEKIWKICAIRRFVAQNHSDCRKLEQLNSIF